jgi:hypothetical protein
MGTWHRRKRTMSVTQAESKRRFAATKWQILLQPAHSLVG